MEDNHPQHPAADGQSQPLVSRRRFLAASAAAFAAAAVGQVPLAGDDEEEVWSDGTGTWVTRRLSDERHVVSTLDGVETVNRYEAIMPPCTVDRDRFHRLCTACGACVAACPTAILHPATSEYGTRGVMQPTVSFDLGWCRTDCNRCGQACPTGAIRPLPVAEKRRDKLGFATFNSATCVVRTDGVECDACARHCPHKAITIVEQNGHRLPRVSMNRCTGCGACEYYCPARPKAIYVEGLRW